MTADEFTWPVRDVSKGAWFGSPELKAWALAKMVAHRAQDEIIRGQYQLDFPETVAGYKGCLVGCTLPRKRSGGWGARYAGWDNTYLLPGGEVVKSRSSWHRDVELLYGIPWEVANLLDDTFEDQPWDAGADFAVASIEAIPVGFVYDPEVLADLDDWYWSTATVLEFLETGVTT